MPEVSYCSSVMFCLLNENAGHRLAASAVVVDETTGGTSDFPCANRNRSSSSVCWGFVAAFDREGRCRIRGTRTRSTSRVQSWPLTLPMTNQAYGKGEAVGHDPCLAFFVSRLVSCV